jgi:hypothetical protein
MSIQTTSMSKGTLLAVGAAALILAGCASSGEKTMEKSASSAKVHCAGLNSCKGSSDCKTAENSCKGQNACAGHGFLSMSETDCKAKGGKII